VTKTKKFYKIGTKPDSVPATWFPLLPVLMTDLDPDETEVPDMLDLDPPLISS
jgi:hypothetical protein